MNSYPRRVALLATSRGVGEYHASVPHVQNGGCAVPADSVRPQAGPRAGARTGVMTGAVTGARTTAGCCSGMGGQGAFAMDRFGGP